MIASEPITENPAVHATLAAALTAAGVAPAAARFNVAGDVLTCAMHGREFILAPELRAILEGAGPAEAVTVYGTQAPTGAAQSGAADVLAIADDGRVFAGLQAFGAGAAHLCTLADADARTAIVAHLVATLPTRQPR